MNNITGIEVAKQLRTLGCSSQIIFLTSSEEYVFESFESSPLHYIIKGAPQERENFERIFLTGIDIVHKKETEIFRCENNHEKKDIQLCEISHFEINRRIVTVYYNQNKFEFHDTLEGLQDKLPGKVFVRCHRFYIVNIKYIDRFNSKIISLVTGDNIPIESTYTDDVKTSFSSHLIGAV